MRNSITLTLFAAICIIFAACNPYTTWEKTLINDSSKNVILYASDSGGGFTFTDSVIIAPNTSMVIYSFGDVTKSDVAECDLYISRLTLDTDTGFVITKNIQDAANWESATKEADQGFDNTCTFTVTEADISIE
ncbi:MAG: hypothetical protein IPL12_01195 [Bacteroidetes bacterium]|nr:hypothetical protein [Bacteroidota bacterium]